MADGPDIKDLGLNKWFEALNELEDLELVVGILGESGFHEGSELSIADLAFINEFGSDDGKIPERPAHRQAFEHNRDAIERRAAGLVRRVGSGQDTPRQALDRIGVWYVGEVREEIIAYDDPGNSEFTIENKGEDNPLIHTSRTLNSVTHDIRDI